MMHFIDKLLNKVTMYRLVAMGLGGTLAVASVFAAYGVLAFGPLELGVSVALLLAVSLATNWVLARIWNAPANTESSTITALILASILTPGLDSRSLIFTALAGFFAIVSKYLLVWRGAHIFNPAAAGVIAVGLLGYFKASWWIGSASLLPIVAILGFLVVRKIHRGAMVWAFIATALATIAFIGVVVDQRPLLEVLREGILSWPLIFFATIMLTEPLTAPASAGLRYIYAVVVGLLFASRWDVGLLYGSPHSALVIGNLALFLFASKQREKLTLKEIVKMTPNIWEYVFMAPRRLRFKAGQYAEWTIKDVAFDDRGNRRYFTIASAPSDPMVRLGVKFYQDSSAFKERLQSMQPGETVMVGQVAGDFVLPQLPEPVLFLAGGIGVTPFRSMLEEMAAQNDSRNVILCYGAANAQEIVYRDTLARARVRGVRIRYVLGNLEGAPAEWGATQGYIDQVHLSTISDLTSRRIYISGPNVFVDATKHALHGLGVSSSHIVTDYFPGY